MIEQCPICEILFLRGESALWCRMGDCPKTKQRRPTMEQVKKFRLDPSSAEERPPKRNRVLFGS